jgi:hypothetical protein
MSNSGSAVNALIKKGYGTIRLEVSGKGDRKGKEKPATKTTQFDDLFSGDRLLLWLQ